MKKQNIKGMTPTQMLREIKSGQGLDISIESYYTFLKNIPKTETVKLVSVIKNERVYVFSAEEIKTVDINLS